MPRIRPRDKPLYDRPCAATSRVAEVHRWSGRVGLDLASSARKGDWRSPVTPGRVAMSCARNPGEEVAPTATGFMCLSVMTTVASGKYEPQQMVWFFSYVVDTACRTRCRTLAIGSRTADGIATPPGSDSRHRREFFAKRCLLQRKGHDEMFP